MWEDKWEVGTLIIYLWLSTLKVYLIFIYEKKYSCSFTQKFTSSHISYGDTHICTQRQKCTKIYFKWACLKFISSQHVFVYKVLLLLKSTNSNIRKLKLWYTYEKKYFMWHHIPLYLIEKRQMVLVPIKTSYRYYIWRLRTPPISLTNMVSRQYIRSKDFLTNNVHM